jgi:hypothetical protein
MTSEQREWGVGEGVRGSGTRPLHLRVPKRGAEYWNFFKATIVRIELGIHRTRRGRVRA